MAPQAEPGQSQTSDGTRAKHRRWVLLALAVVLLITGPLLAAHRSAWVTATDAEALVPKAHRAHERPHWLQITAKSSFADNALARRDEASRRLDRAGRVFKRAFAEAMIELGPVDIEAQAWLDHHREWRIPSESFAGSALADHLSNAGLERAARRLVQRMSLLSFGLLDRDERRDPLALESWSKDPNGWFAWLDTPANRSDEDPNRGGQPRLGGHGELRAADGRSVLIAIRRELPLAEVRKRALAIGHREELDVVFAGRAQRNATLHADIVRLLPRSIALVGCALACALALSLRRSRRSLALALCVASIIPIGLALHGGIGLLSWPLCILAMIACCDIVGGGPNLSRGRWLAVCVWSSPAFALVLCAYPGWQKAAWASAFTLLAALLVIVSALPALIEMTGAARRRRIAPTSPSTQEKPRPTWLERLPLAPWSGPQGHPWAALCSLAVIAGGFIYVYPNLQVRGPTGLAVEEPPSLTNVFTPAGFGELEHEASDPETLLHRAAGELVELREQLSGDWAIWFAGLDSPAAFVLPEPIYAARHNALAKLELPSRQANVAAQLDRAGLHSDAFDGALGSIWQAADGPHARALLGSNLGPWAHARMDGGSDGEPFRMRSRFRWQADMVDSLRRPESIAQCRSRAQTLDDYQQQSMADRPAPRPAAEATPPWWRRIKGSVSAELIGRIQLPRDFLVPLGLQILATSLTLAFALRHRTTAVVSAITQLMGSMTLAMGLQILAIPLSPWLLPSFAALSAGIALSTARACGARAREEASHLGEWLAAPLCMSACGASLAALPIPQWVEIGWSLAVAGVIWLWLAGTVAPGLQLCLSEPARMGLGKGHRLLALSLVFSAADAHGLEPQTVATEAAVGVTRDRDLRIARSPALRQFLELWRRAPMLEPGNSIEVEYQARRSSSLLRKAVVSSGKLAVFAEGRLELRGNNDTLGATWQGPQVHIFENDHASDKLNTPMETGVAFAWLSDRVYALFSHQYADRLIADSVVRVARNRRRIVIQPRPESAARRKVRELRVSLGRHSGEIEEVLLTSNFGDELRLRLSQQHRAPVLSGKAPVDASDLESDQAAPGQRPHGSPDVAEYP